MFRENSSVKESVANYDDFKNKLTELQEKEQQLFGDPLTDRINTFSTSMGKAQDSVNGFLTSSENVYKVTTEGYFDYLTRDSEKFSGAVTAIKQYQAIQDKTGKTQEAYLKSLQKVNPVAAQVAANTKVQSNTMLSYGAALVGAKLKTFALTAATTALNAVMTFGISAIISLGIEWISSWINSSQNAIDNAEKLTQAWEETASKLKTAKDLINDKGDDFEKLSKGVDDLGRNINLTSAEYSNYLDIVNQIADSFPELISGYDEEGNAILRCKGNVDKLTEAYQKLNQEANAQILRDANDVFSGFKDTISGNPWNQVNKTEQLSYTQQLINAITTVSANKAEQEQNVSAALKQIGKAENTSGEGNIAQSISDFLTQAGIKTDWYEMSTLLSGDNRSVNFGLEDKLIDNLDTLKSYITVLNSEMSAAAADVTPIIDAYLQSANDGLDYSQLSDISKDAISRIKSTFNAEFYRQFSNSFELERWVQKYLLDAFSGDNGTTYANAVNNFFNTNLDFEEGSLSIGEYRVALENLLSTLSDIPEETLAQIKLYFNIEDTENLYSKIKDAFGNAWEQYEVFVNSLSNEDIQILYSLKGKYGYDFNKWLFEFGLTKSKAESQGINIPITYSSVEDYKDKIDEYQSKLSEISGYYSKKLSGSDIVKLQQDFPKFNWGIYDLSNITSSTIALQDLAKIIQDDVKTALKDKIPEDFINSIVSIGDYTLSLSADFTAFKSSITELTDAYKSLNDGSALTLEQTIALVDKYPELMSYYDSETKQLNITKDSVTSLFEVRKQACLDGIKLEIASAEAALKAAKTVYSAQVLASAGHHFNFKSDNDVVAQLNEELQALYAKYELFSSAVLENFAGSNSNSTVKISDTYARIIAAIENAADKRIEALNKEKEALQDKNEEEERTNNLLEKQIALQNALKKTVFVYKEGQGFVEVADKGAVKSAQNDLATAESDVKIAELEDKISKLEDYKSQFSEASNDYTKEQNLELAKRIFGNADLTNLSDSTIATFLNGYKGALANEDTSMFEFDNVLLALSKAFGVSGITNGGTKIAEGLSNTSTKAVSNIVNSNCTTSVGTLQINVNGTGDPETVADKVLNVFQKQLNIAANRLLPSQ